MENKLIIANRLLETGAVKLRPDNPFTWASGWKSPIYCNNREALFYQDLRSLIIAEFCKLVVQYNPDVVVGVSTGGIAWGAIVAEKLGYPYASVRTEAKDHGMKSKIDGVIPITSRVVVIEDLISTGGSSLKAVETLREYVGASVLCVAAIFTYEFPQAISAFKESNCELKTICDYSTLLKAAYNKGAFKEKERDLLCKWRESPDTWGR
jgi:orotate phosphoribosyltransferase